MGTGDEDEADGEDLEGPRVLASVTLFMGKKLEQRLNLEQFMEEDPCRGKIQL